MQYDGATNNTLYSCTNLSSTPACGVAGGDGLYIPTYVGQNNLFMQTVNGNNYGYIPDYVNKVIHKCTISGGNVSNCSYYNSFASPVSIWIHDFSN
jgi:hypothetical protein